MESFNLSLRNLYKVLTKADYPVYTMDVFPSGQIRNLTLVSFWKEMFRAMFNNDVDLSVFNTDSGRSRSLSKLMGGLENTGFKAKWYEELASKLSPERMLLCIDFCYDFFKMNHARADMLEKRLKDYIDSTINYNGLMPKHVLLFLSQLPIQCAEIEEGLVRSSYVFAWLSVYALFSGRMDDPYLNDLKRVQTMILQMTVKKYSSLSVTQLHLPEIITNGDCVLKYTKLDKDRYIGNEELIKNTVQNLRNDDKLLISGIGGIGKTEFIRQLLPFLISSNMFTHIAYMQYTDSLVMSLNSAFPQTAGMSKDKLLDHCRTQLCDGKRTLFVIDDLSADKDEVSYLASLKCCIIVSSRMRTLQGFRRILLPTLTTQEGLQLFSVVSGQTVANDYGEITHAIEVLGGHPLLITMIAKISSIKYWSGGEINQKVYRGGLSSLTYVENGVTETMHYVLKQMYDASGLNSSENRLLILMAMLPTKGYIPAELSPMAKDCFANEDLLANAMQKLADYSYLMRTSSGYEMHPAVAECFLTKTINADDYPLLWAECAEQMKNITISSNRSIVIMTYELLKHAGKLNRNAISAVVEMESMFIRGVFLYDYRFLMKKHKEWLDTCTHEKTDEERYWISLGYYALVMSRYEYLDECLDGFEQLDTETLLSQEHYSSLTNVLDNYLGNEGYYNAEKLVRLITRINPGETDAKKYISYLCLLSLKYRSLDHDIEMALKVLKRAEKTIINHHMETMLSCANVDNRIVFCLADLGRYQETLPYIERCLHVMRINGYTEDSPSLMATRSTYGYMLMSCNRIEDAILEYESLERLYIKNKRMATTGGVGALAGLLRCYLLSDRLQEIKKVYHEFWDLLKTVKRADSVYLMDLVISALCLLKSGDVDEVLPLIEKAHEIAKNNRGIPTWKKALIEGVEALRLCILGKREDGIHLFEQQYGILEKENRLSNVDVKIIVKYYNDIKHN